MRVETAIALIENLVYKPGWEIEVKDYTKRFEGGLCVTMCCDTYQTERPDAEEGYPNPVRPRASFLILVADLKDDCELYKALLDKIIEYEIHEAREFLRVRPTMWAPFHPHKADGMARWGNPQADIAYGMV